MPKISQKDHNSAEEIKLPVLKVRQKIGEFFLASMPAKTLVDISYADVRRLVDDQRDVEKYLGIQRPVSPRRIKQIKQYISSPDATFPTSVILSIDERCAEYDEKLGLLTLQPFEAIESEEEPIPYNRIAKVLDGQHRIAGFIDFDQNEKFEFEDEIFDINVAIFIGADISTQANIFATVNLAQTKVNKSLVYDLTELADTRSPYRTCHNIAVALDSLENSPLHHRIKRLGVATPGRRHETLTQAAFVESLVRFISKNPSQDRNELLAGNELDPVSDDELAKTPFRNLFIEEKDLDIAEILINYFTAVKEKWPKSWIATDITGNLLPKSNAFKALMRYLRDDVYLDIVGEEIGEIPTSKEFSEYFAPIKLRDRDFTTSNFAPGSGGEATFLKMLRREIDLADMIEK